MRRLDIGMASYGSDPSKLLASIHSIQLHSVTDWRLFVIHNPSPGDEATKQALEKLADEDKRINAVWQDVNVGYAGAVNMLFAAGVTEYLAWCDNDARILTPGWDEALCSYLDRFHEIGLMFPNWGHYAVPRGPYHEVLWAAGFCWVIPRMAQRKAGLFDTTLGHHEEVDYSTRIKLEGYRLACATEVQVAHNETSTRNPAAQERIAAGVVRWMNKALSYFCGKDINYHSPNVLRVLDWNVNAQHMEAWFKLQKQLLGLNDNPESVTLDDGSEWDLIRVPRPKGFYRSRII